MLNFRKKTAQREFANVSYSIILNYRSTSKCQTSQQPSATPRTVDCLRRYTLKRNKTSFTKDRGNSRVVFCHALAT